MAKLTQDELKRMLPEKRVAIERRRKKVQRNRRILAVSVLVTVVLVTVVVLSLTVFFPIDTITVKGDCIYDETQIINASGIVKGENLFLCDSLDAQTIIPKNLTYISTATVKRKLPSTIIIEVKGTTADFYFKSPTGYAVTDLGGKVLEIVGEDKIPQSAARLKTKNIFAAEIGGNYITLNKSEDSSDEIKAEMKTIEAVLASVKESGLTNITEIDVSATGSIFMMYQNRLKLNLGGINDLTYKLKSAVEIIKKEDEIDPGEKGEIFLSNPNNMYVSPEKN